MKTNYNIERNRNRLSNGFNCIFTHNNKYYFADLCLNMLSERECMIFNFDYETKQVSDWKEVYCKRDIELQEESLIKCIEEFKEQYN